MTHADLVRAHHDEWIAAHGLWLVNDDDPDFSVVDRVLADPNISLNATALYSVLVAEKGQPVNPYLDAFEPEDLITEAVAELLSAGLATRVLAPPSTLDSPRCTG